LYGIENFSFDILKVFSQLEVAQDPSLLTNWENYYMVQFDSLNPEKGYNKLKAGDRQLVNRKGISIQQAYVERYGKEEGNKKFAAVRQKISEALSGRPKSSETKRRMSAAHRGRATWNKDKKGTYKLGPQSEEHKQKLQLARIAYWKRRKEEVV